MKEQTNSYKINMLILACTGNFNVTNNNYEILFVDRNFFKNRF